MRDGITFSLSEADCQRLSDIAAAPLSPQKHVWRTRIVLLSSDGLGTSAIMTATGKSKTCVWRWQERFMHEGVDGLLRDMSRPPGRAPVPPKRVAEIVRLTQARGDPLDSARYGQGGRACRFDSAVDLVGAWPCAASLAKLQAIQRSGFRREASRYRRPLCFATCTCGGAVLRREVPDSGA